MIEIGISAIKGGFRELYQTSNSAPKGIASSIRPDSGSPYAVGREAYAISFSGAGLVCTKCKIIRDVLGGSRVGNIAFSLLIPVGKKLAGGDIKTLLDKLSEKYCREYIDRDNNLGNVYEEWSFVNAIANQYESRLHPDSAYDSESVQQGPVDAAFVYYSSDEELQKYFDKPYQEEYNGYKQIFFIEKRLEGKPENPLNALRHSENNLTGKMDLENPYYKLFIKQGVEGLNIEIRVNGKAKSTGNRVRKKDVLNIRYKQKFRKTEYIEGTWEVLKRVKSKYIEVDDERETITLNSIQLSPEKIKIPITVIDELSGKPIHGFRGICTDNNKQYPKKEFNEKENRIEFEGDEIGNRWCMEVTALEYKKFVLDILPEMTPDITFRLIKKRVCIIKVKDNNNDQPVPLNEYKLEIYDNKRKNKHDYYVENEEYRIDFTGEEIEKEWYIDIIKSNYEICGEKVMICPRDKETKHLTIYVEKKNQRTRNESRNYRSSNNSKEVYYFSFTAGKHGKVIRENYYSCNDKSEISAAARQAGIKPDFGYKIDTLNEKSVEGNYYICEVRFKPIISPVILGVIAFVAVAVAAILYFAFNINSRSSEDMQKMNAARMMQYVKGDTLFLETLMGYQIKWKEQEPIVSEKGGGIFSIFGGGEKQPDSAGYKKWYSVYQSIDSAITKRELINAGNFPELNKQHYYPRQQKFKTVVKTIDSTKYEDVRKQLADVNFSTLTLNQIADSILAMIAANKPADDNGARGKNSGGNANAGSSRTARSDVGTEISAGSGSGNASDSSGSAASAIATDITGEIMQYLRGSELNEQKLEDYKNTKGISTTLKASIQLCLDFWKLDGSDSGKNPKTYRMLRERINADNTFKYSKLKTFLDEVYDDDNPSYSKQDKKKGLNK